MLDTAEYFEQRGELDKAVLLYQKAGKEKRAVELCFSGRLYETLASIANKLTSTSEPALLARCGECRPVKSHVTISIASGYVHQHYTE